MSNAHTYMLRLSCTDCNEELSEVEVGISPDEGHHNLISKVDVQSVRLALIQAIASHEYESHVMSTS